MIVMCWFRHWWSQSIDIQKSTKLFSASVLGAINRDAGITNTNYAVKVSTYWRQQFSKVIKKSSTVFTVAGP